MRRVIIILLAIVLAVVQSAFADHDKTDKKTKKKKSDKWWHLPTLPASWKGSNALLGIVVTTGNSETTNLNGGLNLSYEKGRWKNVFQGNGQFTESQGITTQQQFFLQNQTNYSWGKNFIFGNLNYTQNRFSPYDYQGVGSIGYGRTLFDSDKFRLTVQVGPGVRVNSIKQENEPSMIQTHPIGTAGLNMRWRITDSVIFTEDVTYNFGNPYDYLKTVTALTNKIIGNLATQISYTTEYYSRIPRHSSHTQNLDTTLNVSLVYNLA